MEGIAADKSSRLGISGRDFNLAGEEVTVFGVLQPGGLAAHSWVKGRERAARRTVEETISHS